MSSNIGAEAGAAYEKYLDSKTVDEKIKRLQEFLSLVPKHKATEKIVALNKSRLSKLKRQQEEQKKRIKGIGKKSPFSIKKEGIQVILISDYRSPGVGKTSLLNLLTSAARDKIGKFNSIPEVGIYQHGKIRYQIVDMPSMMEGASNGVGNGKEILSQIRSCDLICICIDLSRNYKDQMNLLLTELTNANIRLNMPPPPITIKKTGSNKVQIFYLTEEAKNVDDLTELTERIKEIVIEGGIRNCIMKIYGRFTLDQVVDALSTSIVYKKAILLGTKGDLPHTSEVFNELKGENLEKFPIIIGTSVKKKEIPENFGEIILKFLKKIKIFTMNAGKVSDKPLLIDHEAKTVKDVALKIHRSFYELFDHAIVMREGARQKRKKVGLDYELEDNDVIELHTI